MPMMEKVKKMLPYMALVLLVMQLLLMLGSWFYSAAFPMSGVRSLLSGEGMRWLLGHFSDIMATPVLVGLLLLSMGYGCLYKSGLLCVNGSYRESRARMITLLLLLIIVGVMLLLVVVPHAVLLSATGTLWPSPFSASIIPVVAFSGVLLGAVYGIVSGHFTGLHDIFDSLLYGISMGAPLLLFYILLNQIYESVLFVIPA